MLFVQLLMLLIVRYLSIEGNMSKLVFLFASNFAKLLLIWIYPKRCGALFILFYFVPAIAKGIDIFIREVIVTLYIFSSNVRL